MKIHHVGIAVKDIQKALVHLRKFHSITGVSDFVFDPKQDATLCLVNTSEGLDIELISGNKVKAIAAKGIGMYHTCYEVEDLDSKLGELQEAGAVLVSPPQPAVLFGLRRVAFLWLGYGLIELLELQAESLVN